MTWPDNINMITYVSPFQVDGETYKIRCVYDCIVVFQEIPTKPGYFEPRMDVKVRSCEKEHLVTAIREWMASLVHDL